MLCRTLVKNRDGLVGGQESIRPVTGPRVVRVLSEPAEHPRGALPGRLAGGARVQDADHLVQPRHVRVEGRAQDVQVAAQPQLAVAVVPPAKTVMSARPASSQLSRSLKLRGAMS
jgi:hypothetical protein